MTRRRSGRQSATAGTPTLPKHGNASKTQQTTFDARQATLNADLAEDYAYDAIDFALNAIDEAESAR